MNAPLDHVSASQIETFELCPRKWYFKSVMKLPTPEHASAALGKATHADIEAYLNGEKPATALGALARRVYDRGLLPTPGTVRVEHAIPKGACTVAGVALIGFIDVLDVLIERPRVTDWKTRGSLAYVKHEEQLRADIQMNIYAAEAFRVAPGDPSCVEVQHVNIETRAPNVVTVTGPARLTRAEVGAFFAARIVPAVESMKQVALLNTPMRVTANLKACAAYGGCPFRDKCKAFDAVASISVSQPPIGAPMSSKSILDRLPSTPAAASAPAPGPVRPPDAPASGAKAALLARLNGGTPPAAESKPAAQPSAPAPRMSPAASAPEASGGARPSGGDRKPRGFADKLGALGYDEGQIARMTPATMHEAIDGAINARNVSISKEGALVKIAPKPAPAAEGLRAPAPGVEAPDLHDLDSCATYAKEGLGFSDAEVDAMSDDLLVFACERKIARGTVDLEYEGDKISDLTAKPEPPPVAAPARTVPLEAAPAEGGLWLYVGCRPVKGAHARAVVSLEEWYRPLAEAVARDAKVEHYTMIDFGQGPPRLAALALRDPPTGVFTCDRNAPGTNAVLEVLRPLATNVVIAGAA